MTALTTRDTNIQNDPPATTTEKDTAAGEENMAQASQQHRQVLEQKIADKKRYAYEGAAVRNRNQWNSDLLQ